MKFRFLRRTDLTRVRRRRWHVASRLAEATGRAIGLHYEIGPAAVGAIRRRIAMHPDVFEVVESLAQQLKSKKVKHKV